MQETNDDADESTSTLAITVTGVEEAVMLEAFGGDDGTHESVEQYFDEGMWRRLNGEHGPDVMGDDFEVSVTFAGDRE